MENKRSIIIRKIFKYLLVGLFVALTARYVPKNPLSNQEVIIIALTACSAYCIVDTYSPSVLI